MFLMVGKKIETSKSCNDNGFRKSSYANGNCQGKPSRLKSNLVSRSTVGKEFVWRAKAGHGANLAGEVVHGTSKRSADTTHVSNNCIKSEVNSGISSDDNTFNSDLCYANGNDDSEASKLKKTPSSKVVSSVGGKDYVWRAKAGQGTNLVGEGVCGTLKSPFADTTYVSNYCIKSEANHGKSFDDNIFNNGSFCANGNDDSEASNLKKVPSSMVVVSGVRGKDYVWRAKAGHGTNLAGEVVCGTSKRSADTTNVSNNRVKSEVNSGTSSDDNNFNNDLCYANGNDDSEASKLKKAPSSTVVVSSVGGKNYVWRAKAGQGPKLAGVRGKDYVWRAKAGQGANLAGEVICGTSKSPSNDTTHVSNDCINSEANCGKSSDDNTCDNDSCYANGNDNSKASKSKRVPSSTDVISGVCEKDCVWRVNAGQDATLEGEVPRGIQTTPSADVAHPSHDGWVKCETSSQSSGDNGCNQPCYPNSNGNSIASRLKGNPVSVGNVSSVLRKEYVWRPRKGQGANLTGELLSGTQTSPSGDVSHVLNGRLKRLTFSKSSDDSESSMSCFPNGNDDSQAARWKKNPVSMGTAASIVGKDYECRVRTKGTPNENKPLKVEVNKKLGSAYSSGDSLLRRDADSNLTKNFEDFLLDILGPGIQLEKSAIQEVIGNCGYDMKKSLEAILDLAAVTLDKRNGFHEVGGRKQKLAERGSRTMRANEKHRKEVLTTPVHVSERPDSTFSAPVSESSRRSIVIGTVLNESQEHNAEDHNAKTTDEAEEDSYQILRKTVKDYRDKTKEYYRAAAEAFASGDHAGASDLLEKGQFFYNKAREADEESAEKIFEISGRDGEMQDDICLDLQNHDAKEAMRLVKCHLRSLSGILSIKNLKIIFGIGEQDEKCKRVVIRLLEREAIEWIEDKNTGTISIRLDQINPKCFTKR